MTSGPLYDDAHILFLEELWGEGFMSPGGTDEVALVLAGLDLSGATVLDIGCGAAGATMALVENHHAAHVVGVDVETPVCEHARRRIHDRGLSGQVEIRMIEPGPIPFPDGGFDVVFSKDSIVHIADKESLARDVHRLLKPGGWFAASDWLIAHDDEPSAAMGAYLAAEDLDFGMASPQRYHKALEAAGLTDVTLRNRNDWYRVVAREELDRLSGSQRRRFDDTVGPEEVDAQITTWQAMLPVLDSGEHCPHHLRARKPV